VKKLRVTVNGVSYDVDVEVLEDDDAGVAASGLPPVQRSSAPAPAPAAQAPASSAPAAPAPAAAAPAPAAGGNTLQSPLAGIVVELKVAVGDQVNANDHVIVIEAMKMNTNVAAPVTGKVKTIDVKPGESVKQNQVLMTFE
jgi:biotin carboxyl carrier protein